MSNINSIFYEFFGGLFSKIKGQLKVIEFKKKMIEDFPHHHLFIKHYYDQFTWQFIVDEEKIIGFLGYNKSGNSCNVVILIEDQYVSEMNQYLSSLIQLTIDLLNIKKSATFNIYLIKYDSVTGPPLSKDLIKKMEPVIWNYKI